MRMGYQARQLSG